MGAKTSIEWTRGDDGSPGATWNPTTGCDRVSPGCDHCYALTMAGRLRLMGQARYQNDGDPKTSGPGFALTEHEDALDQPLRWKRPRRIFVNSMSDLFHPSVSDEFLLQVWGVMAKARQHTFQILTKRPTRMASFTRRLAWGGEMMPGVPDRPYLSEDPARRSHFAEEPLPNVWLGTSIESQGYVWRAKHLALANAAVRFISAEPLLGPVDLSRHLAAQTLAGYLGPDPHIPITVTRGISWVIVGGESGRHARPMHPDWARSLRDQCQASEVAFLFKQWGEWAPRGPHADPRDVPDSARWGYLERSGSTRGLAFGSLTNGLCALDGTEVVERVGKHAAGRELDGRTWDEYP